MYQGDVAISAAALEQAGSTVPKLEVFKVVFYRCLVATNYLFGIISHKNSRIKI